MTRMRGVEMLALGKQVHGKKPNGRQWDTRLKWLEEIGF